MRSALLSCCMITLGHTRLDGQHIFYSSAWRCLITHHIARTSRPGIPIFSHTSRDGWPFSEWQRGGDECHTVVPIPGGWVIRHRDTKVGSTVWQMSQFRRWICWKMPQHWICCYKLSHYIFYTAPGKLNSVDALRSFQVLNWTIIVNCSVCSGRLFRIFGISLFMYLALLRTAIGEILTLK